MAGRAAGGAAPRDVRRRRPPGRSSATPCCTASGTASAASTTSAWPSPQRVAVVDVAGESVLVTSDEDGGLHAAYNVCRHRGSQLCPPEREPAPRRAASLRCPYHSWTYAPRRLAARAPHAERRRTRRRSRCTRSASRPGAASSSCTSRPARAEPLADAVAGTPTQRWPTTASATWSPAQVLRYDVAANYKVLLENYNECYHCGPVHPELSPAGAVVRRRRRRTSTGTHGIPHREGAWTFTMTGTTDRAPLPGLDEARARPGTRATSSTPT